MRIICEPTTKRHLGFGTNCKALTPIFLNLHCVTSAMKREKFDMILQELKETDDPRQQAEMLEKFLVGETYDAYSAVLVNIIAENIREEEFTSQ